MNGDQLDGAVHTIGALVGLAFWALGNRTERAGRRRFAFVLALLAGLVTFPGYDRLRGENFLHPPEQFHYVLGAKYFPELGYTGLYDATAKACLDLGLALPLTVRNLRTGLTESATSAYPRGEALLPRFRGMRFYEFTQDLRAFAAISSGAHLAAMSDHGFNATPTWIAIARAIERDAPVTEARLVGYALVDVGLLALLTLVLLAVFGLEATAIAVLFAGTAYTWRFAWTGGSFLRYDWVVALGLALAALRRDKPALAGGLLAWSTALRLFPAAFALAAGLSFLFRAHDRAGRSALARFVLGFVVIVGVAYGAGTRAGRGPAAWSEFGSRIATHSGAWASNHIGLDSVAVVDQVILSRPSTDPNEIDPFQTYIAPIERARHTRRPFLLVLVLLGIAAVAAAARKLEPWRAMPLGAAIVFSMSAISGYYWVMLLVVPFAAPARTTVFFMLATLVGVAIELVINNMTAAHVLLSFFYLAIFLDWIVAAIRENGDSPKAPTAPTAPTAPAAPAAWVASAASAMPGAPGAGTP